MDDGDVESHDGTDNRRSNLQNLAQQVDASGKSQLFFFVSQTLQKQDDLTICALGISD
jgi:hypothetical protein